MKSVIKKREESKGFIKPPKLVTIKARPKPIEIDLHRTAVIVVDMQNAFLSKGGLSDIFGSVSMLANRVVINNNEKIIEVARKTACKIVYLKMSYEPDYSDSGGPESPNWHKELGLVMMRKHPQYLGKFVTRGSWDEEIHKELEPKPGDLIIRKQRYSGFAGTNLDIILRTYNIKYCIYTGVATNVCIESTLRDGYFLDYWPILVSDAINNAGPPITQQATLWNVEAYFGWVTTTKDFIKAISVK